MTDSTSGEFLESQDDVGVSLHKHRIVVVCRGKKGEFQPGLREPIRKQPSFQSTRLGGPGPWPQHGDCHGNRISSSRVRLRAAWSDSGSLEVTLLSMRRCLSRRLMEKRSSMNTCVLPR